MAAYKVTEAREDKYTIVDSDLKTYRGEVVGDVFVRDDGKRAQFLGVLPENYKRSVFRNPETGDYVVKQGNSDTDLISVDDVIEKRNTYELKEEDYIILSNWE